MVHFHDPVSVLLGDHNIPSVCCSKEKKEDCVPIVPTESHFAKSKQTQHIKHIAKGKASV